MLEVAENSKEGLVEEIFEMKEKQIKENGFIMIKREMP